MTLRLAGYAALFGVADAVRDTIDPQAFARTLAQRSAPLPLLWQHRPGQRMGTVELAQPDERGLRVIARVDRAESRAATTLRGRTVSGLSFGYIARRHRILPTGRLLEDVDLLEISVVTRPVQHGARVHLLRT